MSNHEGEFMSLGEGEFLSNCEEEFLSICEGEFLYILEGEFLSKGEGEFLAHLASSRRAFALKNDPKTHNFLMLCLFPLQYMDTHKLT